MANRRSKPVSPFLGRWHIVSMTVVLSAKF
jgi:hypothetical protein